jgi:hypothetical protein
VAPPWADLTFSFEPADIVTQILDFGVPAPIDVQGQKREFLLQWRRTERFRGLEPGLLGLGSGFRQRPSNYTAAFRRMHPANVRFVQDVIVLYELAFEA